MLQYLGDIMDAEKIFEKYFNGMCNFVTPFPYEYGIKKVGKHTLIYEKSKGRSPWSNWELRHAISFLILQGKKVQQIRIGYYTDEGPEEIERYLDNLNEEMVEKADKFGEIKKL